MEHAILSKEMKRWPGMQRKFIKVAVHSLKVGVPKLGGIGWGMDANELKQNALAGCRFPLTERVTRRKLAMLITSGFYILFSKMLMLIKIAFWVYFLLGILSFPTIAQVLPQSLETARSAYQKGRNQMDKDSFDEAIQSFDEAIRLNPNFPEAFAERGLAKGAKGDRDGAIGDYNTSIRLNPTIPETYAHPADIRGQIIHPIRDGFAQFLVHEIVDVDGNRRPMNRPSSDQPLPPWQPCECSSTLPGA